MKIKLKQVWYRLGGEVVTMHIQDIDGCSLYAYRPDHTGEMIEV